MVGVTELANKSSPGQPPFGLSFCSSRTSRAVVPSEEKLRYQAGTDGQAP